MLSLFYAVFATVPKTDPSQTVGITALNFLHFSAKNFWGSGSRVLCKTVKTVEVTGFPTEPCGNDGEEVSIPDASPSVDP